MQRDPKSGLPDVGRTGQAAGKQGEFDMKKLVLSLALSMGVSGMASADPLVGTWLAAPPDAEGALHVTIAPCGSAFCGTIAKAIDKDGAESPDYEHLGKKMIWDMQPDGDGAYSGGKIWAPDTDKTYGSKMNIKGDVLVVKGCVAGGLVCREGGRWKRVN